jgi:hypothetical protein
VPIVPSSSIRPLRLLPSRVGTDRSTVRVHSGDNEIKAYLDGRYLSPEALWHIFEFPAVYRLQVHMPRKHQVYFDDDASPDQLRNRMEAATTRVLPIQRPARGWAPVPQVP